MSSRYPATGCSGLDQGPRPAEAVTICHISQSHSRLAASQTQGPSRLTVTASAVDRVHVHDHG